MFANAELSRDFTTLSQQYKALVKALLDVVNIPHIPVEIEPTATGNFRGFDVGKFYFIERGTISARYRGRTIYVLEEGDILLPDIAGDSQDDATVFYGSESGATLHSFAALEFMRRVFAENDGIKVWTRLLVTYAGLMLRVTAAAAQEDTRVTPGFEVYQPGDVIINQGEKADFVFNLSSGTAEVVVDRIVVGTIAEGEIFGAMAALTHSERSATVRAKTQCSVVKVPEAQFTEMIKTNPATIHSLMVDMANSIVNLNEQLVSLQNGSARKA